MPHILALTSSGRKESISTALVNEAAEAAVKAGCTIEHIDLTAPQLQCCTGCLYCRTGDGCSIDDGLFDKLTACDGIIVGFPIYFSGIAGQGKVFLDRLYPMMDTGFVPRHPGKKVLAIYTQGDPREQAFSTVIHSANYVFRMCGWKQIDSIVCAGTSAADYTIPEHIIGRVQSAAGKLG